jgi:hypothetical protein
MDFTFILRAFQSLSPKTGAGGGGSQELTGKNGSDICLLARIYDFKGRRVTILYVLPFLRHILQPSNYPE